MSDVFLQTLEDSVDAAEMFVRMVGEKSLDQYTIRMALEDSLRSLCECAEWNSMKKSIRLFLQPTIVAGPGAPGGLSLPGGYCFANKAGTATDYGNTTVDNEVMIQGAVWPTWDNSTLYQAGITVFDGELRCGNFSLNCALDNTNGVTDPTTMAQMDPQFHPAADVTSPQGFMLGFPKYPLPPEFAAGIIAAERNAWFIGTYITPDQWFMLDKYRTFTGIVRNYTFLPDPKRYGQLALYVHPCPSLEMTQDTGSEYDLQIKAWRRPMRLSGKEPWNYQGTVAVAAGSTAVTGTNTAFDQRMVGAVMRVAGAGSQKPTGTAGKNPYLFQQTIGTVTDATHLTLSGAAPTFPGAGVTTLTGVGYSVADPCDVPAALWDAYKAGCRKELARYVAPKQSALYDTEWQQMIRLAKGADNADRSVKSVGSGQSVISRLRDNSYRPQMGGGPTH